MLFISSIFHTDNYFLVHPRWQHLSKPSNRLCNWELYLDRHEARNKTLWCGQWMSKIGLHQGKSHVQGVYTNNPSRVDIVTLDNYAYLQQDLDRGSLALSLVIGVLVYERYLFFSVENLCHSLPWFKLTYTPYSSLFKFVLVVLDNTIGMIFVLEFRF